VCHWLRFRFKCGFAVGLCVVGLASAVLLRTGSVRLKATQTYPVRFGHKVASLHIEAV